MSSFGSEDVLTIKEDLEIPEITESEVLVRVICCGINPVETYIRSGTATFVDCLVQFSLRGIRKTSPATVYSRFRSVRYN